MSIKIGIIFSPFRIIQLNWSNIIYHSKQCDLRRSGYRRGYLYQINHQDFGPVAVGCVMRR